VRMAESTRCEMRHRKKWGKKMQGCCGSKPLQRPRLAAHSNPRHLHTKQSAVLIVPWLGALGRRGGKSSSETKGHACRQKKTSLLDDGHTPSERHGPLGKGPFNKKDDMSDSCKTSVTSGWRRRREWVSLGSFWCVGWMGWWE